MPDGLQKNNQRSQLGSSQVTDLASHTLPKCARRRAGAPSEVYSMPPEIMQPTSDALNSSTVCQPSVIMLCLPSQCEDASTIGPGSRYRRTLLTGKSDFACRFMVSHQQCAGYSGAVNGFRIILRSSSR